MSHGDGGKAGYSNHLKNKFRSFLHSDLSCLAGQAVNIPFLKLLRENLSMIKELPILADISLQLIKRFIPSFYTFLTHFHWYAFVLQLQFCCTIRFFKFKSDQKFLRPISWHTKFRSRFYISLLIWKSICKIPHASGGGIFYFGLASSSGLNPTKHETNDPGGLIRQPSPGCAASPRKFE